MRLIPDLLVNPWVEKNGETNDPNNRYCFAAAT